MNILLIEDEPLIQKSLKKLLERKGARVDATAMGEMAIELLLKNQYQRIICDLMLQDISGFDVLEESKKKYSLQEIGEKFIIITAYSSPQIIAKASQYNCQILSKPFDNIHSAIEQFLNNRSSK